MLSVKLLVLDTLIENMVQMLCRSDAPAFFDVYMDILDHLLEARRALSAKDEPLKCHVQSHHQRKACHDTDDSGRLIRLNGLGYHFGGCYADHAPGGCAH